MAQGRVVLALFLSAVLGLAAYSAIAGFSDALSYVRNDSKKLPTITGPAGSLAQLVPAGISYGFYAPRVCSEFRLKMRMGNTDTGQIKESTLKLGAETSMIVGSLNSFAQEDRMARIVASSYASYGFTRNPAMNAAEVRIEAEDMPALAEASSQVAHWEPIETFYFKR